MLSVVSGASGKLAARATVVAMKLRRNIGRATRRYAWRFAPPNARRAQARGAWPIRAYSSSGSGLEGLRNNSSSFRRASASRDFCWSTPPGEPVNGSRE